jgi:hypothetical protein
MGLARCRTFSPPGAQWKQSGEQLSWFLFLIPYSLFPIPSQQSLVP